MRRSVTALIAVIAVLVGLLVAATAAAAAPPTPATPSAAADPSAAGQNRPSTEVTLITGDRVTITHAGGRQAIETTAADRGPGTAPVSFSTIVLRGDTFVLPSDAGAYVGNQLDWSLFDVSALIRGGFTDGATLPLAIDYLPGTTGKTVPGLASGRTPRAKTEPAAHSATFGQALAQQLQTDQAQAHGQAAPKVAGSSLFAGIRSISLDSAKADAKDPSAAGNAKPDPGFNMQTLTLKAIGRDGKAPSTDNAGNDGYFLVEDVDDPAGFAAEIPVTTTKQNWSVPAGTYDVRAFVFTWFQKTITIYSSDGTSDVETVWDYSMSFVWQPQVSIKKDTKLTFDARTAKEVPITRTPDADTTAGWRVQGTTCCDPEFQLVTDRVAPDGTDLPWYWDSGAHALEHNTVGFEMYATPSRQKVTKGSRRLYTYEHLESPSTGHTYDLTYPIADGSVPSTYATKVKAAQLASIPTTYSSEVAGREGSQARFGYQPWETINTRDGNPIAEPLSRTEYVLVDKTTLWQESASLFSSDEYPGADDMFGQYTQYKSGPQTPVRWFDGPRHPGVEQPGAVVQAGDVVGGPVTCPVCRDGDTLGFDVAPYVDGSSTDWGPALDAGNPRVGTQDADAETLDLYTDGSLTAQASTATDPGLGSGPTALPLSSGKAQYQLDYAVTRSAPWSSLSTQTSTRWDFSSSGPKKSDPLPAGWTCGALTGACGLVPLMMLDYTLPLDEHEGVQAPGAVTFTVHAYHQPHASTSATVDTPTVSISYDDGATWKQVKSVVPAGKGTFRVGITTPDPASITGFVSLKVADSDSAGADVSQTIIRAFTLSGSAASRGAGVGTAPPPSGGGGGMQFGDKRVCAAPAPGDAACDAIVHTTSTGAPAVTPTADVPSTALPSGYGPADLASAYHLPATGGDGQTVAVVDAAGDPNIVADVAAYRAEYGLPACTTASGCLKVVNQTGDGPPPTDGNQNWGVETALDMDMVSAACPHCHLLLVVADTPSFDDLTTAEQTAVTLGATTISNSYGSYEQVGVRDYAAAYKHPGVAVVASSGDDQFGYGGTLGGTQFPASVPSVTAVGGTRLVPDAGSSRGWDETAWADGGSGCSAYFAKPSYQKDPNCHMRTVADVSAVADPDTGVAVYDSGLSTGGGWLVVGGTSVAAPLIAGMYGLAGNAATVKTPGYLYRHAGKFNDVTSGANGYCGSPVNYLCNAKKGYDGPTGLGTPNGVGGF